MNTGIDSIYFFMRRKIKNYIKRFFLIDDTPHKVAAGAAMGIFLGIVPGEGVLATLFLSSLFRFNRLAALAGVLAVNMWTTFLVLPLAAAAGALIFEKNYADLVTQFHGAGAGYSKMFFSKIFFFDVTLPIFAGFFITAGIISSAIYFILLLLLNFKKGKKKIHLLHKEDLGD
ncbi:MAG: hypothetical protein UX02_C0002G0361 [Candidatus Moranbacteria bacterium GW2011_GWC1_45_18]|nr:MAG: hypothetical protein UT79_C0001G0100 [Candidatus Moranbacteria bacterium GW2011_GWC2_40_12]KKT34056.1 MAG: hypothetical protein UW19_C0002G0029 [Candidatus Moranbacteria bacterium GW2011_GWF2_44_10]KKT69611.1 MAG: hypothetical protein UW66_C0067G0009 [Candidatus Moranbacteria bacterium GW2011_GWF1_44_4]KKU00118.1 MAG: hypothetical protein UX02_C0002G0361 [Candidatus Moranbacteria bacterium GW2011_GWC1_45_18]OGI22731.1 MAG: hypothetical protein A2194_02960 [Candidatus Moranbacteria bacte